MFAIRAEHGKLKYGVYDFVFDTEDDFTGTPHSGVQIGSTAFIIDTSKTYMLNNAGEWKEILVGNSSGSSGSSGGSGSGSGGSGGSSGVDGGSEDDYDEVIYDGGDIDR